MRTAIVIFLLCLAASSCATVELQQQSSSSNAVPIHKNESLNDSCIDSSGKLVQVPLRIESWTESDKTMHVIRRWKDWEGNIYEHYELKDSKGAVYGEWYRTTAEGNLSTVEEKDIQTLKRCTLSKSSFSAPKRLLAFAGHSGSRI
jgi:hypothetical protein